MQSIRHRLRSLGIILGAVLIFFSAGYLLLLKMIDLDTYKEEILKEITSTLKRQVTYQSGRFTFSFGPAFSFSNVLIKEPDGALNFMAIDNLTCRIDLLPLLRKQLVVHGITAHRPVIRLERRKDGTFNFSDLLKPGSGGPVPLKVNDIKIVNGDVTFIDSVLQQEPLVTRLTKVNLSLDNLERAKKTGIKFTAVPGDSSGGLLSLNGKLHMSPEGTPLGNSKLDAKLTAKQLDLSSFWPYYRQYVPFKKVFGILDTECEFHGQLAEFTSSGRIGINALRFDYQPVFKRLLAPKSLKIKYSLAMNKSAIDVKAVEVNIDGVAINGSCAIRDYRSGDPRITAQAVTSTFDLAKCQQYIPYGIIVKHVADWIEEHIKGGMYRLVDGRLDGRVSQIAHMEKGENYNVLYIQALADKGVVSYGSAVPTFTKIKGTLELKGKDFYLRNMSGYFGESPLSVEGRITDYPLDVPSGYPFQMTISPAKSEIAWLLGKNRASRFSCNGNSSLRIKGDGYTSGYNLSGDWSLTPMAYSYDRMVTKPVGTNSAIIFRGSVNPKEAVLNSLHYTLGGLALDLSTKYQFSSAKNLELLINTNNVNLENLATFSPLLNRYQPSGRVKLTVRGVTADTSVDDYRWKGTVTLNNASFSYSPAAKPLSAINGTVAFDDGAMESSQLTAKVGSTLFSGKGSISSLSPVSFSTSFSSPRIDLTDFGFIQQKKTPQLTKIRGELSYRENNLQIKSLSGNLNSSQITLKGTVTDLDAPRADLAITATYLDIADLLLLQSLEKKRDPATTVPAAPTLKAVIKADKGVFSSTGFERLSAGLNLTNKVLQIQPLEANVLGGRLTGKGIINGSSLPPRYQVEFKLADASAAELIHLIATDNKELTGKITVDGGLTSSGESTAEMKKSAAGIVRFHASRGSMHRFSTLSKVFSILNVSQLFKLKLPDMVAEGMPYNDIKGTLNVKDGYVSTNDFFVASNAINISAVGRLDFVNDNLDFTLGLQPLQTVDKVVSHIPIVGWILTGKEKTLITTYFEIKGKSAEPKVTAIPVKSLSKGVLGIFKRVFQLPGKLVTDTGEVILGN
jgi:uncharacterized protein YhdP